MAIFFAANVGEIESPSGVLEVVNETLSLSSRQVINMRNPVGLARDVLIVFIVE